MRTKRCILRVIALLLVIVSIIMLTACGSENTPAVSATPGNVVENTATPDASATPTPTEAGHKHTVVVDAATEPTCWSSGKTEGSHCSECGEILEEQKFVENIEHSFDGDGTCNLCKCSVTIGFEFRGDYNGGYELVGIGSVTETTTIIIPEEYDGKPVTAVKASAFRSLKDTLQRLYIPNSVKNIDVMSGDLTNFAALECVILSKNLKKIPCELFRECTALKEIIIPDSVEEIDGSAFYGCTNLQLVKTYGSVKIMGGSSFAGCSSLTEIDLNGVTEIIGGTFKGCLGLTKIIIPDTVMRIGGNTFEDCKNLVLVDIAEGLQSIGISAFGNCTALTTINIPESVVKIGEDAFLSCKKIKNLKDGVYYVDKWAVGHDMKTENIILLSDTKGIVDEAFKRCTNLKTITIPEGVKRLGYKTFSGCTNLTDIVIPNSVTEMDMNIFTGCENIKYNIYENGKYLGNESNPYLCLIRVIDKSCESFTFAKTTKIIYEFAFSFCENLKNIEIPNGVERIGLAAFRYCKKIQSIDIPDTVTIVETGAFVYCENLEQINIPNTVTYLGGTMFSHCDKFKQINYNGTQAQWQEIEKEDSWDDGISDYMIYCTDGNIYVRW